MRSDDVLESIEKVYVVERLKERGRQGKVEEGKDSCVPALFVGVKTE